MESSSGSTAGNRKHLAWKYVCLANPNSTNDLICNFCEKNTEGGIYRGKQHIVGGFHNTKSCAKCPPHIKEEIKEFAEKKLQ